MFVRCFSIESGDCVLILLKSAPMQSVGTSIRNIGYTAGAFPLSSIPPPNTLSLGRKTTGAALLGAQCVDKNQKLDYCFNEYKMSFVSLFFMQRQQGARCYQEPIAWAYVLTMSNPA